MSRAKIWTNEEVNLLIEETYRLRIEDPEPSLLQLIRLTQELILPKEKQRRIISKNQCIDIYEGVKKRFLNKKIEGELYEQIMKVVDNRINGLNNKMEKALEDIYAQLNIKEKRNKLRIAIVGLLGDQYRLLESVTKDLPVNLIKVETEKNKRVHIPPGDYAIFSTFVGHSHTTLIEQMYGKNRMFRVENASQEGFLNKIKELITQSNHG